MQKIHESLEEHQKVTFILDDDSSLNNLTDIPFSNYQKSLVFCDKNLKDTWWPKIQSKISDSSTIDFVEFLEPNEETKSLEKYYYLVECLGKNKCSKHTLIIAIGGGTVLDAVAYLASTYMRGIPLMMIPTTLVGQADASTAGKTCINTSYSKNALGTLYLPVYVYNNVCILDTNSNYELRQGFSEIFKYGLLGSKKLLNLLFEYKADQTHKILLRILKETIRVRINIRKKDPLASNLGHTFGHALEKITNYEVNHGDAISVGTVMALEFSSQKGIIDELEKDEIIGMMRDLNLNTNVSMDISAKELTKIMLTDKKSSNTEIRLVLINGIEKPYTNKGSHFYPTTPDSVERFLEDFLVCNDYVKENHWIELKEV